MKRIGYFLVYAGLALAVQVVVLFTVGRWDAFLDRYLFLYYPTMWIVERYGHFSGESRLIEPILLGVLPGVFLYSLIFALILSFTRRIKQHS